MRVLALIPLSVIPRVGIYQKNFQQMSVLLEVNEY